MANISLGTEPSEQDAADPLPPPNFYSTSKPEEGSQRGEIWAVLRALVALIAVVLGLGWLVG
jgi:hypothetical protein